MVVYIKSLIHALVLGCFFMLPVQAQDAFVPSEHIVYPKDKNGVAAKTKLIDFISGAKKSISMAAYHLKDPDIVKTLCDRARAKVGVRMIVETMHFPHANNQRGEEEKAKYIENLKEAGVEVHERPQNLKSKYPDGHAHAKYIIRDGKQLLVTTGNFDETTFDHCIDTAVVIVDNIDRNKNAITTAQTIFNKDFENQPVTQPDDPLIIVGPEGQREKIMQFLKTATQSIRMCAQYFNDPDMTKFLTDLKRESPKIDIKLLAMPYPSGIKEDESGNPKKDPNQAFQDQLIEAGIAVKLIDVRKYLYMHDRSIVVDGTRVLIGTTPLSPPTNKNREFNIIVMGDAVRAHTQQYDDYWEAGLSADEGRKIAFDFKDKINWNEIFNKQ